MHPFLAGFWIIEFVGAFTDLLYSPIVSYITVYLAPGGHQLLAKRVDRFCTAHVLRHAQLH